MNRKKYRYITCGVVNFTEPICNYRLIGAPLLRSKDSCVRVAIPDDMRLEKCYCDSYSTTEDTRKLCELECNILIRQYGQWIVRNDLRSDKPFHAYDEMVKQGYYPVPEVGYLTKEQLRAWYARKD